MSHPKLLPHPTALHRPARLTGWPAGYEGSAEFTEFTADFVYR